MRTEAVLDRHRVTEANWTDAVPKDHHFAHSETPFFVGRAVAALAADPRVLEKSGGLFASWTLSDEYGFTDVDGRRPHWGRAFGHLYGNGMPASKEIRYEWALVGSAFASGAG
jgi:hypothetical protein